MFFLIGDGRTLFAIRKKDWILTKQKTIFLNVGSFYYFFEVKTDLIGNKDFYLGKEFLQQTLVSGMIILRVGNEVSRSWKSVCCSDGNFQ